MFLNPSPDLTEVPVAGRLTCKQNAVFDRDGEGVLLLANRAMDVRPCVRFVALHSHADERKNHH